MVDGSAVATGMLVVLALQLRGIDGVAQQHQGIRFAQRTRMHWAKPTYVAMHLVNQTRIQRVWEFRRGWLPVHGVHVLEHPPKGLNDQVESLRLDRYFARATPHRNVLSGRPCT